MVHILVSIHVVYLWTVRMKVDGDNVKMGSHAGAKFFVCLFTWRCEGCLA
jgi:hypothetical protein